MKKIEAFTLPKSIWAIGLMTLLMNVSTVIIFSLSPLYLTKVLGVSALGIGVLEGIVEFISWTTRIFSGVISDAMRKRKPLLVLAVTLTCIARPIFAVSSTITGIFISRGIDRIANGLQAPPRDALIGDSAPRGKLGAAYGLRQSLGMIGSTVGAIATLLWLQSTGSDFKQLFWFAAISPFVALIFILFMVKDNTKVAQKEKANPLKAKHHLTLYHIKTLPMDYWRFLFVAFIFCMATYSGAFMILRGEEIAKVATVGPAIMIAQNTLAMLVAYPLGRLFDRFDHRYLLAIGFSIVLFANTIFAFATSFTFILVGAAFWGMQMGINQSLLTATISSTSSEANRGTAFGIYYITAGSAIFLANAIVGNLAKLYGLQNAFFYSSAMAILAILCLPMLKKR
ncbi:MAG: MFS transporter [Alphaproteobacteria bacterium]|nr:MFS transporter [Alphaproteobacteria bacterium]NCQ66766.1 MFS transporter [Alphaproteobacteria bacterium]NCT07217.1 MFS transporter [Alphaproteobacteria bacterium]